MRTTLAALQNILKSLKLNGTCDFLSGDRIIAFCFSFQVIFSNGFSGVRPWQGHEVVKLAKLEIFSLKVAFNC